MKRVLISDVMSRKIGSYQTPEISVMEFEIEKGFSNSFVAGDGNDGNQNEGWGEEDLWGN